MCLCVCVCNVVVVCVCVCCMFSLIVSFLLQPAARVATQVETTNLVVDENGQHERNGRQPPHEPEQTRLRIMGGTQRNEER